MWIGGGLLFLVLATANAAGYRYGTSDQAFYIPSIVRAADASAFPRDAALIDAQGRYMVIDDLLGAVERSTGIPLEVLTLAGYVLSIAIIWVAALLIGVRMYGSWLATAALTAVLTLRHQISRTSANSFEPYFHPRMLAFGIGMLDVAGVLRRAPTVATALVALAALVHVTTGLWFALLVGVALALIDRRVRRLSFVAVPLAAAAVGWALASGPLRGALVTMDDRWLEAVASKDNLFATGWPLWAWAANFLLLGLVWWGHHVRRRRGHITVEETALAWGATALVALFLLTLPGIAARTAIVVQLQITRIFWLVDFVAALFVVGALVDRPHGNPRVARTIAAALLAFSAVRGAYIMLVERPERSLFAVSIPASPWEDAMRWIGRQPRDVHVLADPGHAWKYGASVRVSPGRDVLLEEVKDAALAMYSRDIAIRLVERTQAVGDFPALTPAHAHELAARYGLDYLVTEADLSLPLVYRNPQFRIYALGPP
jgi:hypothetical protein